MKDIAQAAGIAQGLMYHYYPLFSITCSYVPGSHRST
ncbi:hypothetical protein [Tissierella simiarum]